MSDLQENVILTPGYVEKHVQAKACPLCPTVRMTLRINIYNFLSFLCGVGVNPMGVNGGVGASPQSQQASLLQDTMMHLNMNNQG